MKPEKIKAEKEAAIYARYSAGSAQREESIEQQVEECRAFAERNGITIVKVYSDKAISGKTDNRSAFQRMMKDAAAGMFNVVISYKSSRIARNMLNALQYEDKLQKMGIQTLYAREEFGDSAAGRFALRMMMSVNQFYSENLAEDIKRGLKDSASKCYVCNTIPYGYRKGADKKFEIHPEEAEIVRDIFKSYVDGETLESMAARFNAMNIKTKRGKNWNKGSFHRILENERYTGVYIYSDIRVDGGMPKIIEREIFDKAQEYMNVKPHPKGRITHKDYGEYLLTGKLICGECGSMMIGMSGTSKTGALHAYYMCSTKNNKSAICHKSNVRKDLLEYRVTQIASELALSDEVISRFADITIEYQRRELDKTIPIKEELKSKEKEMENYFKAISQGIFVPAMQEKMEAIQVELDDLKAKVSKAERNQPRIFTKEELVTSFKHFQNGDVKDKRYQKLIIKSFVKSVTLYEDKIKIDFTTGISEKSVTESITEESSCGVDNSPPLVIQANSFMSEVRLSGFSVEVYFDEKKELH